MEYSTSISDTVMRRVRFIHAVRPLFSTTALAGVVLVLALWGIGREVWFSHVIHNLLAVSSPEGTASFLVAAFLNTRFIVQVLTVLAVGALVYTLREFLRAISNIHQTA